MLRNNNKTWSWSFHSKRGSDWIICWYGRYSFFLGLLCQKWTVLYFHNRFQDSIFWSKAFNIQLQNGLVFWHMQWILESSDDASGRVGWASAHLEFGSSVNPITTRGADYAHHITASGISPENNFLSKYSTRELMQILSYNL